MAGWMSGIIRKTFETVLDMPRQSDKVFNRETVTQQKVIHLDTRERELYERIIGDNTERIKSLEHDKEDLRDQLREERTLHKSQLELLAASDHETKSVTKTIANLINNIWP